MTSKSFLNCHSFILQKIFKLGEITNENNEDHNLKWPYIPNFPYRISIIWGSGSGKTNALLSLIKEQDSGSLIGKIYLYGQDLNEPKYQFLIKKREHVGIKHWNDSKTFIEYSQWMDEVYEDINEYNPARKIKFLIVFNDLIADIMTNKKSQAIIKKLFIRWRKLNISLVFITPSLPKDVRLNSNEDSQRKRVTKYCY